MIGRNCFGLVVLLGSMVMSQAAFGVIAAKTPPSGMYASASAVVTGTVTKVAADTGTIEAAATSLTGEPIGESVKFKLVDMPAVVGRVKAGSPVVLFIGKRASSSALHVADTWLFPEPVPGSKSNFVVKRDLEANLRQSYPGSTAALVKVAEELKAKHGEYSMLNQVSPDSFKGGAKEMGKSEVAGASGLFTVGSAAGKNQRVLAVTKEGLRPFKSDTTAAGPVLPADATEGLIALAEVNGGLVALKKSGEVLAFEKGAAAPKSSKLWADGSVAVTGAIGNFGEDERAYAIVVKEDNIWRYPLDGVGEAGDFLRLTGERVSTYHKDNPKWLAGATAAALDVNGDRKIDVLINTPAGPLLLINRGFGAFFINADLHKVLVGAAGPLIGEKSLWTATDVDRDGQDDLLIVSETGAVTAVMNPKVEEKR